MTEELQDLLYEFVKARMNEEEQRRIVTSVQILNNLDEESESEIKDELYNLLLQQVSWSQLIKRIHADLPEEEDEDENKTTSDYGDETEEEEQYYD